MSVKSLVLGAVAAAGLFALTTSTASAQVVYTSPPVVTAPPVVTTAPTYVVPAPVVVTRPTYVVPSYGYYAPRPAVSFGYYGGYRGGYYGGYRGGYYGRPGVSFGFNIR